MKPDKILKKIAELETEKNAKRKENIELKKQIKAKQKERDSLEKELDRLNALPEYPTTEEEFDELCETISDKIDNLDNEIDALDMKETDNIDRIVAIDESFDSIKTELGYLED